jgi:hypothetical protein
MKYLILLQTFLITTSTYASPISVLGNTYNIKKLGEIYYVQKSDPSLILINSANGLYPERMKVDCTEIDSTLRRNKRRIQRCSETPDSHSCKNLVKRLQSISSELSMFNGSVQQYWHIDEIIGGSFFDKTKLKDKLATILKTKVSNIKLQSEDSLSPSMEIIDVEIKSMREESRIKLVSSILNLDNRFDLDQYGVLLETSNRLIACDLLDNQLDIKIRISSDIGHVEQIPTSTKKLGFKIYETLRKYRINPNDSKEVQAAYIGYEIGKELYSHSAKSKLTIKSVFQSLIEMESSSLQLKVFSNQDNFEESIFPGKSFRLDLKQEFSTVVK